MRQHHYTPHKVRLSVDCTEEEKMYIKMLAAKEKKTISEFLLVYPRSKKPKAKVPSCSRSHEPNEETKTALRESREGKGEIFESLDDFWKAMGV